MKLQRTLNIVLAVITTVLLYSPQTMLGQARDTGSIFGTITDSLKAVVGRATVTVTNVGTNETRRMQSDSSGSYVFVLLPIGTYTISTEKSGFTRDLQTDVRLQANQNVRVDVALSVGSITTEVTVSAAALRVETRQAGLQQTIDEKRILELPLNGRNPADLSLLAPGLVPVGNVSGDVTGVVEPLGTKQLSVNGSRQNSIRYTLDGGTNTDNYLELNQPFPFPDAVAEFSVQTSGMGVEMGSRAGGAVNVVTKSGSNELHGTGFWYVRNTALNATNFFSRREDLLKRNQYGFTAGFPIVRNKLFGFGGFEERAMRATPGDSRAQTLTAAQRSGDFSGAPYTIFDPLSGVPFANQRIPKDRLSPAAQKLNEWSPLPDPDGFARFGVSTPRNSQQYIARLDYIHGDKHRLSLRSFVNRERVPEGGSSPHNLHGVVNVGSQDLDSGTLVWHYIPGPNLISHTQFTANHTTSIWQGEFHPSVNDFGIDMWGPAAGGVNISVDAGPTFFAYNQLLFTRATFELLHDWSWTKAEHTISFGAELARSQMNNSTAFQSGGAMSVNGRRSAGPGGVGYARADFMLGYLSSFTQNQGEFERRRGWTRGFFVSDIWRVRPRLTLTFGVRWDPYRLYIDRERRNTLFSLAAYSKGIKSEKFINAPAGLFYPGDKAPPDYPCGGTVAISVSCPDWYNLAPRLGFAWDPFGDSKSSVRASYGIFYDMPSKHVLNESNNVAPFAYFITMNHLDLRLDAPYGGTLADGTPARRLNLFPVQGIKADSPFPSPLTTIAQPAQFIVPYFQNWSLTVERQLFGNTVIKAAYVGTKGTHLWTSYDQNPAIYDPGLTLKQNQGTVDDRRRIKGFQKIGQVNLGQNSTYHALQLSLNMSYKDKLSVQSQYTWSKALDYQSSNAYAGGTGGAPNPFNFFAFRGATDSSRPHRLTASWVWNLPSPAKSGVLNAILRLWRLSGIVTIMSGRPFSVPAVGDPVPGAGSAFADIIGDGSPVLDTGRSKGETIALYFDTSRYKNAAPNTYGTSGRNQFLGPGYGDLDVSLVKQIRLRLLGEDGSVELRFEAFNAFNLTNLGQPNTSLTNQNFGRITGTAGDPRILQIALKFHF